MWCCSRSAGDCSWNCSSSFCNVVHPPHLCCQLQGPGWGRIIKAAQRKNHPVLFLVPHVQHGIVMLSAAPQGSKCHPHYQVQVTKVFRQGKGSVSQVYHLDDLSRQLGALLSFMLFFALLFSRILPSSLS